MGIHCNYVRSLSHLRSLNRRDMKTRIVRIGNSQGIRIPKPLLEEAGLEGDVELRLTDAGLIVAPAAPRAGWRADAEALRARGDEGLLDEPVPNAFDDSDWVWE